MELKDKLLVYLLKTYTNGEVIISDQTLSELPKKVILTALPDDDREQITFIMKEVKPC